MTNIEKRVLKYYWGIKKAWLGSLAPDSDYPGATLSYGEIEKELNLTGDQIDNVIKFLMQRGYIENKGILFRITPLGEDSLSLWKKILAIATPIAAFFGGIWAIVDIILRLKGNNTPH